MLLLRTSCSLLPRANRHHQRVMTLLRSYYLSSPHLNSSEEYSDEGCKSLFAAESTMAGNDNELSQVTLHSFEIIIEPTASQSNGNTILSRTNTQFQQNFHQTRRYSSKKRKFYEARARQHSFVLHIPQTIHCFFFHSQLLSLARNACSLIQRQDKVELTSLYAFEGSDYHPNLNIKNPAKDEFLIQT